MKNISDKTKKRLVVGVSLAVCVVLVVLIGSRFATEPQTDDPLPSQSSEPSDVTVDTDAEKEKDVVVTTPDVSDAVGTDSTATGSGADDSGTEQTIQSDVTKSEYTDEQLTNPSQKPNGESASETTPPAQSSSSPSSGSGSSGGGGLPGFDNVPNLGENQGETVDGDGDINKQVGEMD